MKIIAIGDIHGRNCWNEIVKQNPNADLFVFMGDYFDSKNISVLEQINNFNLIIKFKLENPQKVIMLFGNHDFHYTSGCIGGGYTGFNFSIYYNMKLDLERLIRERVLKVCYIKNDILFSHAGITNTWCENNNINQKDLENSINDLLVYKPYQFQFKPGVRRDVYGDDITQGPFWVREKSLSEDGLNKYIHIVGHSESEEIILNINNSNVRYGIIDTLKNKQYLEIITDESKNYFNIKTIF